MEENYFFKPPGLILVLLIVLPFVLGNSSELYVENFSKCEEISITFNGILPIDDGEYIVINNCTGSNNTWVCNCTDNWEFLVMFMPNTINNYTIDYEWDYTEEKKSGGGGNKRRKKTITIIEQNESTTKGTNNTGVEEAPSGTGNDETGVEDSTSTDETTTDKTPETTKPEPTDIETKDNESDIPMKEEVVAGMPWWMIVIIVILFVFGISMLFVYYAFKEPVVKQTTDQKINEILKQVK